MGNEERVPAGTRDVFDELGETTTRRTFVKRAAAAGLSLPVAGAVASAYGGTAYARRVGRMAAAREMKLSIATSGNYFQFISANQFARYVDRYTHGKVKVTVFPNAELADEPDTITGLQNGTIQCYVGSCASATTAIPQLGILDVPYLFDTIDQMYNVMDSSFGEGLKKQARAKGVHVLDWWTGGTRDVFNNGHPIRHPSDMRGMKLRVIQSPVFITTFEAFGAVPTALATGEVYLALTQGTLTGAETALITTISSKQYEAVKYASLTHHAYSSAMVAVSKQWFDALPINLQDGIQRAADAVTPHERNGNTAALKTAIADYKKAGKEVVTPDRAEFKAVAKRIRPKFYAEFGKQQFEDVLSAMSV